MAAVLVVLTAPPSGPPQWDSVIYLEQAHDIARWDVPSGRYPPGLPALLAAGDVVGLDPFDTVKLVAVALVVAVVATARRVGGPTAGAVAGLLCCVSPWVAGSGRYVMADPLAALVAVLGLLAVLARRPGWAALAAVAGVLVRLFSVVGLLALLPIGRRWVAAAGVGAVVLFGSFQWAASGSPFTTGYEDGGAKWAPGYVLDHDRTGDGSWIVEGEWAKSMTPDTSERDTPNVVAYPVAVFGFVFLPPLFAVIGLWALWQRRDSEAARFVGWWLVGSLALALPYFFQSPRLLAPAMMLVVVYAAVGISDVIGRLGADPVNRHEGDVERRVAFGV